jgi:Flp pilus assembly protein TadB
VQKGENIMFSESWGAYIVPVAVFAWLAIAGVAQVIGSVHKRRIQAEERMAMVQRGMSIEQINQLLKPADKDIAEELAKTRDPLRSLANARRTGVVLVSIGIGIVLFGSLLAFILQDRDVLAVSACGLIPLAIGIGFFVDYHLQKRELARFGLEVAADPPPNNPPN